MIRRTAEQIAKYLRAAAWVQGRQSVNVGIVPLRKSPSGSDPEVHLGRLHLRVRADGPCR
jgi:hypothetical protein